MVCVAASKAYQTRSEPCEFPSGARRQRAGPCIGVPRPHIERDVAIRSHPLVDIVIVLIDCPP